VSESKHTPGPWENDEGSIVSEGGTAIANVYGPEDFPCLGNADDARLAEIEQECSANAEFIVRACNAHDDLVAALTDAVETGTHAPSCDAMSMHAEAQTRGCNCGIFARVHRWRAALLKAEEGR
jgi:hypothetical protein